MGCSSCGGGGVVQRTDINAPLFTMTRDLGVGDRVELHHRSGYGGFGVIRRIYMQSGIEQVDLFMANSGSMVTAVPSKGDRLTLAPATEIRR